MKRTVLFSMVILGAALATQCQASIVINYSTTGLDQFTLAPSADQLRIDAQGPTSLTLADNTPTIATINNLYFYVGDSGPLTGDFNFDLSRTMTIATSTGTLSQLGTLSVTLAADGFLALAGAPPLVFNVAGGTVTVTPLSLQTDQFGVGGSGNYAMEASFEFTPVPEPTTVVAGALLLLPFGASTLRILRKRQAA
jgi:hypothetical protein